MKEYKKNHKHYFYFSYSYRHYEIYSKYHGIYYYFSKILEKYIYKGNNNMGAQYSNWVENGNVFKYFL